MRARFTVLGLVEVSAAGRDLPSLAPRHRAVLAYLLLHAETVVSADRLIGAVWGPDPPGTARAQVHAAVTAIRRVLREAGAAELLESRAAGYVIAPGPGQVDLREFTSQVAAAQEQAEAGDSQGAAQRIRLALRLWRGEPLAGVTAAYVPEARARLDGRRLAAFERLAELELSSGRHHDLVDELAGQVAAHPLRERLCGQLMLALHRAGRQADALSAARAFRTTLAEQQGLDPSRAFTALEQAILRDDPHLDLRAGSVAAPAAEAASGRAGAAQARPRQRVNFLPYDTPDFSGRGAELSQIAGPELGPGAAIWLINGMAGIGKTALAVHAAHQLASRFPDGQLFVDLQADTPGREPAEPGSALEILLRQLGVPAEQIPDAATDRAALWRAELSGRTVLAVLDNAASTDHVRPLLPGASRSLLLITSRKRLTGLDGARVLPLDLLPAADSVGLFTRIVGDRAQAEAIEVLDVLHLCGFLPLAIRIAAARLQHRPHWTVSYLASRLRDQRRRLGELSAEDRSVAAAFTVSYQHLDPDQQRMFRQLGWHPGRDFDPSAAAALAELAPDRAEALLEDLLDAHLLVQAEPGRYTFHELLREHAQATAAAQESVAARHDALTRLLDHYLQTASTAINMLYPYSTRSRPHFPETTFGQAAEAAGWLETERPNLIAVGGHAASHEWPAHANQLAAVLRPYLDGHGYHASALTLHTQALRVSRQCGDKAGEGRALLDLGWVCWRLGRYQEASDNSEEALRICRETGDRAGQARAQNTLGNLYRRQGDHDRAYEHLVQALELCRETGNQVGEAHVLGNLGVIYERQGDAERAREHQRRALDLHRELGNRGGEADALHNLGRAYQHQGEPRLARDLLGQALGLYRELGYRRGEADTLNSLGEAVRAMGDPAGAIDSHEGALALAREIGSLPEQARAQDGLARAHRDLGRIGPAREHASQALDLYTSLGVPEAAEARDFLAGLG